MEIINYPNYLIYRDGRVFSKYTNKFLKHKTEKDGYKRICLYKDNKPKSFYIHRLIGIYYIPNPENKPTIDHINRNRSDNRIENLQWATTKEQNNNRKERCMLNNNISGHKGISFRKDRNNWVYQKQGKYKILKRFKCKTDALCFKYIYLLKIKSHLV